MIVKKYTLAFLGFLFFVNPWVANAYDEYEPGPEEFGEPLICRVQRGGVFQNFTVIDQERCTKIVGVCKLVGGKKSCPVIYHWPSGSTTVVEYEDEYQTYPLRINGQRALSPNAIADHTCVLNTKSENLFCVFHPDDPQVANADLPEFIDSNGKPVVAGKFSGLEGLVEKRWHEFYENNIIVESIELIEKEEYSVFGIKLLDAKFKSVVYIKEPFRGVCVSMKTCLRIMGVNNDGLRAIPAGRYEDVATLGFEKGENYWVLTRE